MNWIWYFVIRTLKHFRFQNNEKSILFPNFRLNEIIYFLNLYESKVKTIHRKNVSGWPWWFEVCQQITKWVISATEYKYYFEGDWN